MATTACCSIPLLLTILSGPPTGDPAPHLGGDPLALAADADLKGWLEIAEPEAFVREVLAHPWVAGLPGTEDPFDLILEDHLRVLLRSLDEGIEGGMLGIARDLSSEGLALGFALPESGNEPVWWLGLRGTSPERTRVALERALQTFLDASDLPPAFFRPRSIGDEGLVYGFGPRLAVGRHGAHVVLSTEPERVDRALAALGQRTDPGLLGNERFQRAMGEAPRDRDVLAWIDLEGLANELPKQRTKWRRAGTDPGALIVLGTSLLGIPGAESATLAFELEEHRASLHVGARQPSGAYASLTPDEPAPPSPFPSSERDVLRARLHRDFPGLVADRGELLEPDAIAKLSAGLTEIAVLFAGVDLEADVLPHLSPWVDLVVRPLPARGDGTDPHPRLVALAASVRLSDAERVAPVLETAVQTGVALSTAERAQRGERGYLLRVGVEGGRAYSFGQLPALPPGEPRGLDHNLAPAFAVVGDRMVIATHVDLLRELLAGEVRLGEDAPPDGSIGEHLRLEAAALESLVRDQLDTWIELGALRTGTPRASLRREIERWTERLDEASLSVTTHEASDRITVEAVLEGWE